MEKLNFNVVFTKDGITEEVVGGWKSGEVRGLLYFQTEYQGVSISVVPHQGGGKYIRFFNVGESPVVGFWGIQFPWEYGEDCYTLVPALFYNGNEQELNNTIPMLKMPQSPVFTASFCSSSFPAVVYKNKDKGSSYVISHKSIAGWNGIKLDAQKQTMTFYAPAQENNIYGFRGFKGIGRKPYALEPGTVLTLRLEEEYFPCEEITDLYNFYWEKTIRKSYYKGNNTPKICEKEGAEMVRDWIYNRHCFFTEKNEPIISNAFTDVDDMTPKLNGEYAEWDIMIGWCSGPMTALPLLHFGGKYRDFAVKYIDFLSTHGDSPCGVKYPIYDGESWMDENHKQFPRNAYEHLRFYCDYLSYLGKAIRFEKQNGFQHPTWEQDFEKGIKILVEVWEREKDFGIYWKLSGEKINVYRKGSCAGAFALLAMAEGLLHFSQNEPLIKAFQQGCETYYNRCVKTGRCNGGPADIKEADDSESAAALTDALLQNYMLFETQENLTKAIQAAQIFASWVVNYSPQMPNGSMFENLSVKGGVIANIQNRHVGPGICTNSGRFLYKLGQITGDERWIDLYYQIKAAAINCITTYDGEFFDVDPDKPFIKGMLSEQINLGDSLGIPGETWRVSACWPATAVLLGYIDK